MLVFRFISQHVPKSKIFPRCCYIRKMGSKHPLCLFLGGLPSSVCLVQALFESLGRTDMPGEFQNKGELERH